MGLQGTQLLATLFDGIARHTPGGGGPVPSRADLDEE